ncbi:MAG TPA: biotin--[acetyl-CoA-carboxylase] ligase [Flavobacteriales bacterium]|nr:biotin--[acetyl-CoA-carboxylase] ligase [Flavobacteriales bacterium]HIO16076.1 biotin--[acetyl-CoA-carboxylase] ligase [Flavobacteriales bacterium]
MNANISQIITSIGTVTRIYLPSIGSTNDYAMKMLRNENTSLESLVVANIQSEGKGQRGRHWLSIPGRDLCMSWVLKNPPEYPTIFNMAAALALLEGIRKIDPSLSRLSIKWPNDILHSSGDHNSGNSKKLAGILIENHWRGESWTAAIVGIGVNVGFDEKLVAENSKTNNEIIDFNLPPISLASLTEIAPQPSELELPILEALQKRIRTLNSENGIQKTVRDFNSELFGLNQPRKFKINGKSRSGTLLRVEKDGRAMIDWEDNDETTYLHSSEVVWCWD